MRGWHHDRDRVVAEFTSICLQAVTTTFTCLIAVVVILFWQIGINGLSLCKAIKMLQCTNSVGSNSVEGEKKIILCIYGCHLVETIKYIQLYMYSYE